MVIRRAAREDLDEIVDIWREGALQSWGMKSPERSVVLALFSSRFETTASPYGTWVAVDGDEMLGWQSLQQHYTNPFFLAALSSTYIREGSQRRGVGRALLAFVMDYAKDTGITNIFGHVRCENHASIRLVESLGWHKVGTIPFPAPPLSQYYYFHEVVARIAPTSFAPPTNRSSE